ncbi:circularly permuted type 2 ATP-grasp protein [Microbulbifer sp. YPW1]|uniref:circularly permuted type 2 ATP-grasp protein n=1 Tax=Microbulbifer sp. YPW1 TaxID=2745199 RepID=UPI0015975532|nr:circularly permuted type 2 ATP-grasp protein [Microbulbifer sp. YPW1]
MTAIEQPAPHLYDEMLCSDGVHEHYRAYLQWLENTPDATLEQKRREADTLFRRFGITFNVYGEEEGTERLIPFDLIPRIIPASEWTHLELGLRQRVTALNRFLHDIYHDQEILRAGIIPADQVLTNQQFQVAMLGVDLPGHNYIPITGVDLIRDNNGEYFVLEDNLRTPSGVSYMLENRKMMMRLFPELFLAQSVAPVEHYPNLLLETLQGASDADNPCVVVLTPGRYNSAFFEHAFLAQQMGVPLVEGADLFVRNGCVYMRTTTGPRQVHVIYRRIDDAFLDPLAFDPSSMLGVPGLLTAYRDGNVILANALGTGVADDKSIYPYVPDMIRFYLDEEPILNNVPTCVCRKEEDLAYVLEHLEELVVKEVHGAGGYGMLIGPKADREELDTFRQLLRNNPANYIAQPTLCLSTCPTMVNEGIAPRHIDLRPFVLSGNEIKLVPGGLTRVALREGSLVVNSSQGGGTKDTWVLEGAPC